MKALGSRTLHLLRQTLSVGAVIACPVSAAVAQESPFFERWNSRGCSYTDTSSFDVGTATHVNSIVLWYFWSSDEGSLSYALMSGEKEIAGGTLTRGQCDPNQARWCIARGAPNIDLEPGAYTVRTSVARVCQTDGADLGFIRAFGHPLAGGVQTGQSHQAMAPALPIRLGSVSSRSADLATAAVLGGLLASLGALMAAGLAGIGQSDISSILGDLLKGRLPSDSFEDWKTRTSVSGKVYGSGSPDDPFRDYPDAKNPPWRAPYGDGSAANPYTDTAPAVFGHSPTPPDASQTVHVKADLTEVRASTASVAADTTEIVAHGAPVNTVDKLVRIDPIPEKRPPPDVRADACDTAMIGGQGAPVNSDDKLVTVDQSIKSVTDPQAQLHELTKAALDAAITLEGKGKYVANYDLFDKVRYGLPHLVTSAVDWFTDLLPDVQVAVPETDLTGTNIGFTREWKTVNARAPKVTDDKWGQCGEFEQWGKEQLKDPVKKIFGEDAILTHIEIQSTENPFANHIANEVILKNGDRYVIDMWETMATGEVKIYPESAWIEKWRGPGYVGSYSDVRLGGDSSFEADLTKKIREAGPEEGIKKFLKQYPGHDKAKAEMFVNSYKSNPWQLESVEKSVPPHYRILD